MEMINRAVEDASDFMEMKRKLLERRDRLILAGERKEIEPKVDPRQPAKRPGENREQYRARIFGKAVTK